MSTVQLVDSDSNNNLRINKDGRSPDEDDRGGEHPKKQNTAQTEQEPDSEEYIKDPSLGQEWIFQDDDSYCDCFIGIKYFFNLLFLF